MWHFSVWHICSIRPRDLFYDNDNQSRSFKCLSHQRVAQKNHVNPCEIVQVVLETCWCCDCFISKLNQRDILTAYSCLMIDFKIIFCHIFLLWRRIHVIQLNAKTWGKLVHENERFKIQDEKKLIMPLCVENYSEILDKFCRCKFWNGYSKIGYILKFCSLRFQTCLIW